VELEVPPKNRSARAFYRRVGFFGLKIPEEMKLAEGGIPGWSFVLV
jgi:ribosomal protein S18 acetylase RimI-like enzyme